ncbi:MAG TPA: hypothetical protein VGG68_08840 [Caulobacteraceae bacterium]|jgi:hypothetical protein
MGALLTSASTLMCPHGGTVAITPGQTQAQAGAPIVRGTDTFTIAGCALSSATPPSPCVTVQWVQTATHVKSGGDLALNEASVGLCLAATQAPQGTVIIAATQEEVSGQ